MSKLYIQTLRLNTSTTWNHTWDSPLLCWRKRKTP